MNKVYAIFFMLVVYALGVSCNRNEPSTPQGSGPNAVSGGAAQGLPPPPNKTALNSLSQSMPENPAMDKTDLQKNIPQAAASKNLVSVEEDMPYLLSLRSALSKTGKGIPPRDVRNGLISDGHNLDNDSKDAAWACIELYQGIIDRSLGENRIVVDRSRMINKAMDIMRNIKQDTHGIRILSSIPAGDSSYIIAYSLPGTNFSGEMTIQKNTEGLWIVLDAWIQESVPGDGDDPERKYPEENVRILQEGGLLR